MRNFGILTLLTLVSGHAGGSAPVFSLAVEKPLGFSWYDLEHFGPESESSGADLRQMIRSELNFPLDPFRVSASLTAFRGADSAGPGGLRTDVRAWISVGPAFMKMRDEDWYGFASSAGELQSSSALVKFSDTYSRAETFQFGGGIHRELGDFRFFGIVWAAGLGAEGSLLDYEIFGLEGRQRGEEGWVDVELPASLKALTYRTYTLKTVAGLRPTRRLLGMEWEARLHPFLYTRAYDDHILRKKDVEMECWGAGGALEASIPAGRRGGPGGRVPRFAPYLRAELDRAWGNMKQTYYADSGDTPEDETGQGIEGIRTSVSHWLLAAGLRWNVGI